MKGLRVAALLAAMTIGAGCQGSFGGGTGLPTTMSTLGPGALASTTPGPASTASAAPQQPQNATASFSLTEEGPGFTCPALDGGYSCVVRLNVHAPSPTPSASSSGSRKGKKPTPSPTPSPTPTPTPAPAASASPGTIASPSPTPASPSMSVAVSIYPADAPKMVIVSKEKLPPTVAVMRLALVPSVDFTLDGAAMAQFTLPDTEFGNRGFALQFFEETVGKKNKRSTHPLYSLTKSQLDKQTLTFSLKPPKLTLPKGHKYLMVLYADQRPATPSPAPSSSVTPQASPVLQPDNPVPAPSSTPQP